MAFARRWSRIRLASLFFLTCIGTAMAQQYQLRKWTVENGLPQNVIRGIAQAPDGYLWIATLNGVARFDGVRFILFNRSNTPGIDSNRFSSMVQGRNGDLWLGIEDGALTRYHNGIFHTYGPADGIPANSVRGTTRDTAGHIWILSENLILKWNSKTGEFLDVTPGEVKLNYQPLRWQDAGFWGCGKSTLYIFTQGRLLNYALPEWLPENSIWAVGIDGAGDTWIETFDGRQGLIPVNEKEVQHVDPRHPRPIAYRDAHGRVWTAHVGPRLTLFLDFVSSGRPTTIQYTRLMEDREGNIWVGTEGNGLYQLQEQIINVYSKTQGLIDQNIYPIYQDQSGAIWLGAWSTGLSCFRDGHFTNYTTADGLPGRLVSALGGDREGDLWVGTHGGLAIFRGGRFRKTDVQLPDGAVVDAILEDRGGTMWFGTTNGLVVYRNGPSRTLTQQDGLASNDVRVIIESASGDFWVGGYGGLTRIHGGQFTHWTEQDGLPSNNIRALYEDRDGVLWIGTYDGGLGRFKNGKFTRYTQRDGLFDDGVFQILEDGRGNLWMSSNRGIYRVSKQELNEFAEGKRTTITSVAYGKADGMLNVECNGGMWPAGIKARDGKLWFPTQDGAAVIDPRLVHVNPQPPPVVIEAAYLDHVRAPIHGSLRIPPNKENLEIEYTALSFIHSAQIRFRYQLEGLDSHWIDAGSRRTAYYSHLPPGSYTFHVIADNSDGVWNHVGQSLKVIVLAPFYRTWWFFTLEALVVAAVITLAVYYRISQLQQAQTVQRAFSRQLITSQESERQRIASELHDSLGQRLIIINNLAQLMMRSQNRGMAPSEETMQEISSEAALAIQETREISYNLRPFQLDRLGLTKAVEIIVRTVSSASGIRIGSEIENIDDALPNDLRIHFYRIVQESLNNLMKHSQATEAEVRVARDNGHLILSIRDNGIGFNPTSRPSKGATSGFGLTGMEERARSLGGAFRVRSAPGHGTVMTVEIPLNGKEVS
ncbi:MAG TPA: two-component regulator propeller domain-containing protein [Acidobacteriaceae bacterium]|nr:two-component regulator propeller domain-containing protein [Acidobacteriaceae bacterium]